MGKYLYSNKTSDYTNIYFAGERIMAPGELPVAFVTGREVVQWLYKDNGIVFLLLK